MSFHRHGHGHKKQYQPCTSAKASASHPFPWVLQMSLLRQTNHQRNTQGDDEQQRLTKVAFVYQLMQGIAQGTYIVLNPFSSHAHYQLHKSGTCHNPLNTCMLMEIVVTKTQNDKHTLQQTNLCQKKCTKLTIEQGLTRVQLILSF